MLKIIDKYLLREMAFPFALALVGFIIFIMLNLILQLGDFLLDKSIGLWTVLKILFYKLPDLLILAIPVATLFAIFLTLGRLSHDREVIALQAGGFSLKRIVVPILIMGLLLSLLDLFLNEALTPWGNQKYYTLIRQMILKNAAPQIKDNAFFKDAEDRFFYVRHYDRENNRLSGVLIYDMSGGLFVEDDTARYPKVITAEEASWQGNVWELTDGAIHTYDDQGDLKYKARFEKLSINVGSNLENLFLEQRTPYEMSSRELRRRIQILRASGLSADSLIVEYHAKLAIPMAGFVFALFGAPLSLLFGYRSRAAGIVISILLVGLFQGTFLWMEALGKRGILQPAVSVWLPHILFAALGFVLLLLLDRVSRIDLWERLRRIIPLGVVFGFWLLAFGQELRANSQPIPLELKADSVTISKNWEKIEASGNVLAAYGEDAIKAESLIIIRQNKQWELNASGSVVFENKHWKASAVAVEADLEEDAEAELALKEIAFEKAQIKYEGGNIRAQKITLKKLEGDLWEALAQTDVVFEGAAAQKQSQEKAARRILNSEELRLRFELKEDKLIARDSQIDKFTGETQFKNSRGETHPLRFQGAKAKASFDDKNEINTLDISKGAFTTCGCEEAIPKAAYSISADRIVIFTDELLMAFNITLRAFGVPILWAPFYVAPLKEEQKNPFLPELGRDSIRGWYAKWRLPFLLDPKNFGFLLFDYFNKTKELGAGIDFRYEFAQNSGTLRLYRLSAISFWPLAGSQKLIANSPTSFDLDWSHTLLISDEIRLDLAADLRNALFEQEEDNRLLSQAVLTGQHQDWRWSFAMSRDQNIAQKEQKEAEGTDQINYGVLERMPELAIAKGGNFSIQNFAPLNYSFGINWGRYREKKLERQGRSLNEFDESTRLDAAFGLGTAELALFENQLKLRSNLNYRFSIYGADRRRDILEVTPALSFTPMENLTLSADYTFRGLKGETPFSFDKLVLMNKALFRASWSVGSFSVSSTTGYDLARRLFDPLKINLAYRSAYERLLISFASESEYDVNQGVLRRIGLQGSLQAPQGSVFANTAYDPVNKRYNDLIVKLTLGKQIKLGLSYDLNRRLLKRINSETAFSLGDNWEISFKGEFDFLNKKFTAFQYGLIKKFCNACWELGIYGSRNQIWIQVRINAFPSAEIKYSPTDKRLAFGGK